jgi:predicted flap endonuclease-1-like 5' DNA nuclease
MGTTYTFAPDEHGRFVAEVWNPKHIQALVAVIHYQLVKKDPDPLALTEISPTEAVIGGADVELNCVGTGFTKHSLIIFNGGIEPTTYVSDELLTTVVKPSTAETAGSYPVLIREGEEETSAFDFTFTEAAEPEAPEEPPAEPEEFNPPKEPLAEPEEFVQSDDLIDEPAEDDGEPIPVTNISGIGPTTATKLADIGITDARQIAALTLEEANALDLQLGLGGRIARDGWVEQAKALIA